FFQAEGGIRAGHVTGVQTCALPIWNQLGFHFARFLPSDTTDVPALARALRRQMADAVRDGQIDANVVSLEFLHYRPLSMMLRVLDRKSVVEGKSVDLAGGNITIGNK